MRCKSKFPQIVNYKVRIYSVFMIVRDRKLSRKLFNFLIYYTGRRFTENFYSCDKLNGAKYYY